MLLAHLMEGERGRIKDFLLKLYARHEIRILRALYGLLSGRVIRVFAFREIIYRILVYPAAKWGIPGTPISPYDIEDFIESIGDSRIAVGPCRCRLAHGGCDHPVETDIVVLHGYRIWKDLFPEQYREISVVDAVRICRDCHRLGLAQIIYSHMDIATKRNCFVICNCCSDGCLPLLSLKFYGPERYPFNKGRRRASVNAGKCLGCGRCVEVCLFGARKIVGDLAKVGDCLGCGLCVTHCTSGASIMS